MILITGITLSGQIVIHDQVDTTQGHPIKVKQRIEATILQYTPLPFIHFSQNYNTGANYSPDIIANHSYTWGNIFNAAEDYWYRNILNVVAHGQNASVQINYQEVEPWVRVAAIGTNGQNNNTSYGAGLDFVEMTNDEPFVCLVPCQSSATPNVTAKLWVIKHRLDSICACDTDWFYIYDRARRTASNGFSWNERTGYGVINVNSAVLYSGTLSSNDWITYEFPESTPQPLALDSFPRKTALTGTEVFKTYRNEVNGYNSEFTAGTFKKYVLTSPIWLNSSQTVGIFTGIGSPEGVVTASVGSTYHRTDGGSGTSFYVKETGTGNAGWIAK